MAKDKGEQEQPEWDDAPRSRGWENYPLDSVFVRTEVRAVVDVVRRIKANRFDLNPEFQRAFIWPVEKQSRLIESCLMRLPLPVFYMAEGKDGRIMVVDGLQRLTTFQKYLEGDFALTFKSLDEDDENNINDKKITYNKKFQDLDVSLQERIEDTQLTFYILDANAPERAKLDIFERVNGGVPLTRQQMRNCLYNGQATRFLKEASELDSFKQVISDTFSPESMRDREAVNRFCAFYLLGQEQYQGDLDDFLARALEYMNSLSKSHLKNLMSIFDDSMKNNYYLFGKHAFRKSISDIDSESRRSVINIALFDVCSVVIAQKESAFVEKNQQQIRQTLTNLLKNREFFDSITSATGKRSSVEKRFNMVKKSLEVIELC